MEFFRFAGEDGNDQHTTARFYLPPVTSDDDELNLHNAVTELEGKIDAFSGRNSGWTVAQIKYFRLCWGQYRPMNPGSYLPTPKSISVSKAVLNIQNFTDHDCFQYSVLAALHRPLKGGSKKIHRIRTSRTCRR